MFWKPIETAPKDGTIVLVSEEPYPKYIGSARYDNGIWWWESEGHQAWPNIWAELPNPPVSPKYKWKYVCPDCGEIMFYRKEKPSGSDDVSATWIGSVYPNGIPLKPTDSKACPNCGCGHLELENFKLRDDATTHP